MEKSNRVAIITGAANGIGRGIAEYFLYNNYQVLLVDINEEELKKTKEELSGEKGNLEYVAVDLTDLRSHELIVNNTLEKFGQINVLVNCAGIFPSKSALKIEEKDWDQVFDLNVKSLFFLTKVVVKNMISNKVENGNVVNITSTASEVARPGVSHYCASKAAVKMLTQVLALELAPYGIRVNAVGPGLVETDTLLSTLSSKEAIKEHKEKLIYSPLGRTALVEEIASSVYFISSSQASYITGQNLLVDGGYSAGRVYKSFLTIKEKEGKS